MLMCPASRSAKSPLCLRHLSKYFQPLLCLRGVHAAFLPQSPERSIVKIVNVTCEMLELYLLLHAGHKDLQSTCLQLM